MTTTALPPTTPEHLVLAQGLGDRGNVIATRMRSTIGLMLMTADGDADLTVHLTHDEARSIARNLEQLADEVTEA